MMFVNAIPSALRLAIGHSPRYTWLQQAVAWARQAPDRGNAWTASDHYWTLTYAADTGLAVETSWCPKGAKSVGLSHCFGRGHPPFWCFQR